MAAYPDIYIGLDYDLLITLKLKTGTFPSGADTWTWKMLVDKVRQASGTPALEQEAASAVLSNGDAWITLSFSAAAAKTLLLAGNEGENDLDITSTDSTPKTLPWPWVRGPIRVRRPLGTA